MKQMNKKSISMFISTAVISLIVSCTVYNGTTSSLIPKGWFSDGRITKPKPHKFSSSSNLEFHQISWQYFLWLTEQEGSKLRFENLFNDSAIDPGAQDPKSHVLAGIVQAGSEAVLVDENGRAVYTTMMINDIYRDFCIKNKLHTQEGMLNASATLDFPVGAFSLKAAWKIVADGEDTSRMYTTKASVQLLDNVNGKIVFTDKVEDNVKVALVGFHIAVVVEDHPEFIWATFEHVDNAPFMAAQQEMNQAVSESDFTFYKAQTTASKCNINNAKILTLDPATQKMTPVTQAATQFREGSGSSVNQNNIADLNAAVHAALPTGSVWRNYREVGAVWFLKKDNLKPNWNPNTDKKVITGSTKLSNAVIETFTQNVVSQNECFSCHNSMAVTNVPSGVPILPGKNINTSHILIQNYLQGNPAKR